MRKRSRGKQKSDRTYRRIEKCRYVKGGAVNPVTSDAKIRIRASFTVEAAMLMTLILPALLALIYLGLYLHDRGVLNGAAQEVAAQADLNCWKDSGNVYLSGSAGKLADRTGPSGKAAVSVSAGDKQVSVTYNASMTLPGLLPKLFGRSVLDTGASVQRTLLKPADTIRIIRGLEYVSKILGKGDPG